MSNITKIKPSQKTTIKNQTIQIYNKEKVATIGIKTGIKSGPHYGGKGSLKEK